MRLRLLFALLFCAAAWAGIAWTPAAPSGTATGHAAVVASDTAAPVQGGTTDADGPRNLGQRAIVAVTGPLWSSLVVHADVAGLRSAAAPVETRRAEPRVAPASRGSTHLLHIPLLI